MKTYSGITSVTKENIVLDSGAFFKNFIQGTDTFDSAVAANKLIGATRGGGQFIAKAEVRNIDVDGAKGNLKGMNVIDAWEISIQANVLEVTPDTLKLALGIADIDTATDVTYDIITGRNEILDTDYLDNVTWIGTISGSSEPVIIQVFNGLNTDGLTLATAPKNESVITMTFQGHFTETDLDTPPYKIYYPK